MDDNLVDGLIVLCSLIYNIVGILIFVLRAHERVRMETKLGPVFNTLLVPFSFLWIVNLISGRNSGRLITGIPIIIFLIIITAVISLAVVSIIYKDTESKVNTTEVQVHTD